MVDKKLMAEFLFAKRLLNEISPTGILSYVSDSYDFWSVVTKMLPALKEDIMAREGKFVIRPDSGCPVKILTGYKYKSVKDFEQLYDYTDLEEYKNAEVIYFEDEGVYQEYSTVFNDDGSVQGLSVGEVLMECEVKGLIEALWGIFGGTLSDKGFKMLDEHIGAIYGDSITLERQREIYQRLMDKGFCPEPVLGIGSYSFQYVTRDTHGSAVKATNVVKNGVDLAIAKDPKTDTSKKSAKGLLMIDHDADGNIFMKDQCTREEEQQGLLRVVFEDGKLFNVTTLEEIRALISSQI